MTDKAVLKELARQERRFVGTPNARGGKYVCYGLTSRGFIRGAEMVNSATPDGRNRADHFSKNIAPSVGSSYFARGGIAMNINIVSPEMLRDAQWHPEKYENLQVRVAGWNIRWNDIPKKEQDEYILRAESVAP